MKLKELRIENGYTQKHIAEKMSKTITCICDWERGRTEPGIEDLKTLSTIFNVSVDYLIGRTDDFGNVAGATSDATLTNDERSLLTYFRSFTDAERKNWLDLMKMSAIKTTSFSATNKI